MLLVLLHFSFLLMWLFSETVNLSWLLWYHHTFLSISPGSILIDFFCRLNNLVQTRLRARNFLNSVSIVNWFKVFLLYKLMVRNCKTLLSNRNVVSIAKSEFSNFKIIFWTITWLWQYSVNHHIFLTNYHFTT